MSTTKPCQRAKYLRTEADSMPSPLAVAYKRRAAELELEAYLNTIYERVAVAA